MRTRVWEVGLDQIGERPAAASPIAGYAYDAAKRALDLVGAAVLLVCLSPIMFGIAVAIFLDSGLPIIYRSSRVGRQGRLTIVLKFRTMRDNSHHHLSELLSASAERQLEYHVNRKLRDDPRRTRVGGFLRRTSLDELPQVWNVLVGQMSLVGPRPYFADELLGRPEALEILSARPGITGLWQVNGRSDRTFEERVVLDLEYVRSQSFMLDISILVRTVQAVLSGRGAY